MNRNFSNRDEYLKFLGVLMDYCDTLAIAVEEEGEEFLEKIEPFCNKRYYSRKFPGVSGGGNMLIKRYGLCSQIEKIFEEFDSFGEVGYDEELEYGLDMAFYKGDKLVFSVVSHEELYYVEDFAEKIFAEV